MSIDATLIDLADVIGTLPEGDTPAAWYTSTDPEVLSAYDRYVHDHRLWNDRYTKLLKISGFPANTTYVSEGAGGALLGVVLPKIMGAPPRWWRRTDHGYCVPRKRTKAEKASEVNKLFKALVTIPRAIDYLPGMPNALWFPDKVFLPQVRRPALAVCVFLARPPEQADPPFEVSEQWTRMKMSLWHLLKERQSAARPQRG